MDQLRIALHGLVLLQDTGGPADRFGQRLRGQLQLHQVIGGLDLNRSARILEFLVAGQHDEQRKPPVLAPDR